MSTASKFKDLDMFGAKVELNFKGSSSYKTKIGALLSIMVIMLLTAFGVFRLTVLIYNLDPDVSKKGLKRDLKTTEAFNPFENGFDVAIGLTGIGAIPPKYGYLGLRYIHQTRSKESGDSSFERDYSELELDLCSNTGFNF